VALGREGGTRLWLPPSPTDRGPARRRAVFYNAAMQLDRDLNVAVVRALYPPGPGTRRGWEMLAATGVRGLRLVEETDAFAAYDFTEANPVAFEVLERNVHESGHSGLTTHLEDAVRPVRERAFDYVDLDPFGTPAPFLDAALRALAADGVLAVTATDMPVLTGVARGVCERRYGGRPIRGSQGPEGGLRLLLAFLIREAARRSLDAEPVLSYVHDHYVRTFLRTRPAQSGSVVASKVGDPSELGLASPAISGTGPFGPMWLGPLFDADLVGRLEVPPTAERPEELRRFLDRVREESAADRPFYYEPNVLASELHLSEPPPLAALLAGLQARGFVAARSHVRPSAFRTTAPRPIVFETTRALGPGH
jgi:tRNA (guanine26-N2/guanine27-N2)-dimethyltransferase